MIEYGKLVGHEVVPCSMLESFDPQLGSDVRRVAEDVVNGMWVSTVFLRLNHAFTDDGPPMWFETMVFPSKEDLSENYCDRYSTWEEAEAGHRAVVELIKTTGKPPAT